MFQYQTENIINILHVCAKNTTKYTYYMLDANRFWIHIDNKLILSVESYIF